MHLVCCWLSYRPRLIWTLPGRLCSGRICDGCGAGRKSCRNSSHAQRKVTMLGGRCSSVSRSGCTVVLSRLSLLGSRKGKRISMRLGIPTTHLCLGLSPWLPVELAVGAPTPLQSPRANWRQRLVDLAVGAPTPLQFLRAGRQTVVGTTAVGGATPRRKFRLLPRSVPVGKNTLLKSLVFLTLRVWVGANGFLESVIFLIGILKRSRRAS